MSTTATIAPATGHRTPALRPLSRSAPTGTRRADPRGQARNWGDALLILGHHYQQDEVIRFADLRGDSYKLSQLAAESQSCRAIVFCGVHFMAETADVLSRDEVAVYLPDLSAGCSMADMADLDSVEAAWEDLSEVIDTDDITPGHLHQLVGRPEGVLRPARRDRLHQLERPRRARVVVRPPAPGPVLPRPAPRPEHRPDDGRPARSDARLGSPRSPWAATPPTRSTPKPRPPLAGPLLGPPDVQARARRRCSASGSPAAASSSIPSA